MIYRIVPPSVVAEKVVLPGEQYSQITHETVLSLGSACELTLGRPGHLTEGKFVTRSNF